MNEAKWSATDDVDSMLRYLTRGNRSARVGGGQGWRTSERKLRLFVCACCREVVRDRKRPEVDWEEFTLAVGGLERSADVEPFHTSRLIDTYFHPDWDLPTMAEWASSDCPSAPALLRDIVGNPHRPVKLYELRPRCPECASESWLAVDNDVMWCRHCNKKWRWPEGAYECPYLTPTVLSLAQAAYEERVKVWKGRHADHDEDAGWHETGTLDPFRLALVADALEEAGCVQTSDESVMGVYVCEKCGAITRVGTDGIKCGSCGSEFCRKQRFRDLPHPMLEHLRSPGPHYRGMWSLDLCLGRG